MGKSKLQKKIESPSPSRLLSLSPPFRPSKIFGEDSSIKKKIGSFEGSPRRAFNFPAFFFFFLFLYINIFFFIFLYCVLWDCYLPLLSSHCVFHCTEKKKNYDLPRFVRVILAQGPC